MNNTITILRGISGSGKSSHAKASQGLHDCVTNSLDEANIKKSYNLCVLSSDAIRVELTGDMSDQSRNGEVFDIMKERLHNAIESGRWHNIMLDATHLTPKSVAYITDVLDKCNSSRYEVMVLQFPIDVEDAIANVKHRHEMGGLDVPEYVIKRQYENYKTHEEWFKCNFRTF